MSATPGWQPGAASAGMGMDLENLNLIGRDATVHSKVTWAAFRPLVTGQTWATFSDVRTKEKNKERKSNRKQQTNQSQKKKETQQNLNTTEKAENS